MMDDEGMQSWDDPPDLDALSDDLWILGELGAWRSGSEPDWESALRSIRDAPMNDTPSRVRSHGASSRVSPLEQTISPLTPFLSLAVQLAICLGAVAMLVALAVVVIELVKLLIGVVVGFVVIGIFLAAMSK
jgi:hypothetical protein